MWNSLFSLVVRINHSPKETIGSSSTPHPISPKPIKHQTAENHQSCLQLKDLTLLKKISKGGKFSVYLVQTKFLEKPKKLAMKVFPHDNDKIDGHFTNELLSSQLCHPNVISIISSQYEEKAKIKERPTNISYILMEYAPYGDFMKLVMNPNIDWHDKLIRTYFHQLIEGIDYIHSQGVAHLDLKLENLLLGEDFDLKIADFDISQKIRDHTRPLINIQGTKNCRAPEIINHTCEDPEAADIFSAGIILFLMKSRGVVPYLEDDTFRGDDLYDLLHTNPQMFWQKHSNIQNKGDSFFDESFQSLFMSMTKKNSQERVTINDIKNSEWYQGPIYPKEELSNIMGKKL